MNRDRLLALVTVLACHFPVSAQMDANSSFQIERVHVSEVKPAKSVVDGQTSFSEPGFQISYHIRGKNMVSLESIAVESIIDPSGKDLTREKGEPTFRMIAIEGPHSITTHAEGSTSHFGLLIENGDFSKANLYKIKGKVNVVVAKTKREESKEVLLNDKEETKIGPFPLWANHPIPHKIPWLPGTEGGVIESMKIESSGADAKEKNAKEAENAIPASAWGRLLVRGPATERLASIRLNGQSPQEYTYDWFGRTYLFSKPNDGKLTVSMIYWTDPKSQAVSFK